VSSKAISEDIFHTVLIYEILQGKINSFEFLIQKYHSTVSKIVLKHVPRTFAPEIAQEAFVRAYESLRSYKGTHPFKHWLSKITLNCCYDFWREKYKNREIPESALSEAGRKNIDKLLAAQSEEAFFCQAREKETIELLDWALDQLSVDDRMVLTLIYFEGCSIAEVAEFLDWTESNVKVHSFRARQKLREILSKVLPERTS